LLEAEITGGLEHPGIVPVYGLGTYGDGRPYYAMRFIRGDSLKVAIARFHADAALKKHPVPRSLEQRKLLRRFLDVCNAIAYAHSRGVLHRDLKPGNDIVGRHGEMLVVDWGLAKATGRADARGTSRESGRPVARSPFPPTVLGSLSPGWRLEVRYLDAYPEVIRDPASCARGELVASRIHILQNGLYHDDIEAT
jgi:serine/threonine protein kinase